MCINTTRHPNTNTNNNPHTLSNTTLHLYIFLILTLHPHVSPHATLHPHTSHISISYNPSTTLYPSLPPLQHSALHFLHHYDLTPKVSRSPSVTLGSSWWWWTTDSYVITGSRALSRWFRLMTLERNVYLPLLFPCQWHDHGRAGPYTRVTESWKLPTVSCSSYYPCTEHSWSFCVAREHQVAGGGSRQDRGGCCEVSQGPSSPCGATPAAGRPGPWWQRLVHGGDTRESLLFWRIGNMFMFAYVKRENK